MERLRGDTFFSLFGAFKRNSQFYSDGNLLSVSWCPILILPQLGLNEMS